MMGLVPLSEETAGELALRLSLHVRVQRRPSTDPESPHQSPTVLAL